MARSEKAEQTYQKILAVSTRLFYEQGYEKTSIQDILNELKMSKGAVYYHFKSKKEILDAIQEGALNQRVELRRQLMNETQAENAREKLTKVFFKLLESADFAQKDKETMLTYVEDPHNLLSDIRAQMDSAEIIASLFEEGNRDGSIETEYPLELAEITLMLLNTWLNPVLFNRDFAQTERRYKSLQQALNKLGANILSDEIIDKMMVIYQGWGCFK
jgi:AcrR family transcriptional regulator